jgi:hypothetical protein
MNGPYVVLIDIDASREFEEVKGRGDRKAVYLVLAKLHHLGPKLVPPHMKPLKGEPGLMELRPRQGRSHVRPIYRRRDDEFIVLAFTVKQDKADFDAAVAAAKERSSRYGKTDN